MLFRLDLPFLDSLERIVELRRDVPPWQLIRCGEEAAVLELPSPM
jgi:uncharacterized membrane protein (UPF0127 family)